MRITRLALAFAALCLFATPSLAGDIPNSVYVQLTEDGITYTTSNDWTGTLTVAGVTMDWTMSDYSAVFTFTGSITTIPWVSGPYFMIEWLETGPILPLSVDIVSTTSCPYDLWPVMQPLPGGPSDDALTDFARTGNSYFGHEFHDLYTLRFGVAVHHLNVPYSGPVNMTVSLEWGPGVPVESASWGAVKSLYR